MSFEKKNPFPHCLIFSMIMKLICKPAGLHCIFWAAKKSYLFIQGQNGFWPRNIKNAWLGDYFDRWQKYAQGIPWQSVINCNPNDGVLYSIQRWLVNKQIHQPSSRHHHTHASKSTFRRPVAGARIPYPNGHGKTNWKEREPSLQHRFSMSPTCTLYISIKV